MNKIFIIAGLLFAGIVSAQQKGSIGVNAEPNGATLQVNISSASDLDKTKGQGLAVPNVTKATLSAMTSTIATSAMVYVIGDSSNTDTNFADTTTNINRTNMVTGLGYYYFNGTQWVRLGGASTGNWEDFKMSKQQLVTSSTAVVDKDAWSVYADYNGSVTLTLPTLTTSDAGKMITFFKKQQGNISFVDENNMSDSMAGSKLIGSTGVTTNRAKILMWNGSLWMPVSY